MDRHMRGTDRPGRMCAPAAGRGLWEDFIRDLCHGGCRAERPPALSLPLPAVTYVALPPLLCLFLPYHQKHSRESHASSHCPKTLSSLLSSSGEPASKSLCLPRAKRTTFGMRGIARQWGVNADGTARPVEKTPPSGIKNPGSFLLLPTAHRGPQRRGFLSTLPRWGQGGGGHCPLLCPCTPGSCLSRQP